MTVHTLMDLRFHADEIEEAHKMLHEILVDTRAFDGCLGVDVLVDLDDPAHVVLFESWPPRNTTQRTWRGETEKAPRRSSAPCWPARPARPGLPSPMSSEHHHPAFPRAAAREPVRFV